MLRCTSDVPPAIVFDRTRKNDHAVFCNQRSPSGQACPAEPSKSSASVCTRCVCSLKKSFVIDASGPVC